MWACRGILLWLLLWLLSLPRYCRHILVAAWGWVDFKTNIYPYVRKYGHIGTPWQTPAWWHKNCNLCQRILRSVISFADGVMTAPLLVCCHTRGLMPIGLCHKILPLPAREGEEHIAQAFLPWTSWLLVIFSRTFLSYGGLSWCKILSSPRLICQLPASYRRTCQLFTLVCCFASLQQPTWDRGLCLAWNLCPPTSNCLPSFEWIPRSWYAFWEHQQSLVHLGVYLP